MKNLIVVLGFFLAGLCYAEGDSLRCNKKQSKCEVQNKRITIGDKVGVFSKDGFLVAIGEVTDIRESIRIVKMKKKYGRILKSHRAQIITDREAKKPKKYFKIMKGLGESYWAAHLDFMSMGIGNGFTATGLRGQYQWKWSKFTYFIISGNYLAGSGEASAKLLDVSNTTLDLSVIGLSGGIAEVFRPYDTLSVRASVEGGFGLSSVTLGVDGSEADILNDRIVDGTVLLLKGEVSAIYRWKGYHPMVGLNFLSLHNSTNIGFAFGVIADL